MKLFSLFISGALLLLAQLSAQSYPLSENSWDNPEFMDRFLGSYGMLTDKEPQITNDESEVFTSIGEMLNADNIRGAIQTIQNAIDAESSAALDYTLGNLLLQDGDYRQGIRAYESAIRKFPNFLRAYKNAGLAYVQLQDYENGSEFIVKSIELGNQEGDSFGLLGYCYLNMGMNQSALDAYRMAGVLAPNNKDWQIGKATALQRVGLYEEAVAKFDELIAQNPNNEAFYMAAANASISLQQSDKAAKYLEVLRRSNQVDADVLMLLGDIYINRGVLVLATEVYTEVLSVVGRSDVDLERILRFARGLISYNALEQADTFLDELEGTNLRMTADDESMLLNLRSQLALAQGDSETAVATLEEVVERNPLDGDALLLLGGYYYGQEDFETAVFYYERAQKIQKFKLDALVQTARVRVAQRKFVDAIDLLQQAQAIEEQSHVQAYLDAIRNALRASS